MPTPLAALAAVAAALDGVDPADRGAVARFYRRRFRAYPVAARELIADFVVGLTARPSGAALARLTHAISGRLEDGGRMPGPRPHGTRRAYNANTGAAPLNPTKAEPWVPFSGLNEGGPIAV